MHYKNVVGILILLPIKITIDISFQIIIYSLIECIINFNNILCLNILY